jgi:hypothetical protein
MKFTFREFIDETFPIWISAATIWIVIRFLAGTDDITAILFATIAACVAGLQLIPGMIKRMREVKTDD